MNKTTTSFFSAGFLLLLIFVASAAPIPLYGLYHTVDGLTYGSLALSAVFYFIGALGALLLLGRLSNHWGRRSTSLLALALAALGCFILMGVHSPAPLLTGRFLQGLSCGLASSAVAAWLVDSGTKMPPWLTPTVISCGPMFGLTIGSLGSGALTDFGLYPRLIPFVVLLLLMVLCGAMLITAHETVPTKPGALASLKPQLTLPDSSRKAYPIAAAVFVTTWSLGGFFQAFGPAMASEQLHSTSALAAALVFASVMAPSVFGASLASRLPHRRVQRYGMMGFTTSLGGLLTALYFGLLGPFLLFSLMAGLAQGALLSSSIHSMVKGLEREQRASVLSVIYLTSYLGAAVPTLISGKLASHFNLFEVASCYGLLALIGTSYVLFTLRVTKSRDQHEAD